jgi:hypothetical protein
LAMDGEQRADSRGYLPGETGGRYAFLATRASNRKLASTVRCRRISYVGSNGNTVVRERPHSTACGHSN